MKSLFLLIAILGLLSLSALIYLLPPTNVDSKLQLDSLNDNQKVALQGIVIKETQGKDYKTLLLDNGLSLQCDCPKTSLLNRNISAIALVEVYNNKHTLNVLSINSLD